VACPDAASVVANWREPICGFDFGEAADRAANTWFRHTIDADGVLAPGQVFASLDYRKLDAFDFAFSVRYVVEREGTFDGLAGWFESRLAPGARFSTAPDAPPAVYEQAFFPLSRGYEVVPGDAVEVEVAARFEGDEHVFEWNVAVEPRRGAPQRGRSRAAQ